jgi:hypothetical protein
MALLCLLAFSAPSLAVTIYVDDLGDGQVGTGMASNPYRSLQVAIDRAASGDTIFIRAGEYGASPVAFIDPTCGNCDAASFRRNIPATFGFRILGKSLVLQGESRHGTVLRTGAGYGVFFEHAGTSRIENLTITGGTRDANGDATNGAIVARWTTLTVRNATLIDNNEHPEGVNGSPGICGIAGREGSVITADNLLIYNNSWDGIALYRGDPGIANSGARATITNVTISQGQGVGIGVTWDAQADITNAHISSYWKGVGSFGTSRVTLRNSFLRDQLGWGVMAFGPSSLTAINNLILEQGRFGLGQWTSDATVVFINNIVYGNGWNPSYDVGPRTGIWLTNLARATVTHNDSYYNSLGDACFGYDCVPFNLIGRDGNISADPSFVNGNAHDFTLLCNSPALNAGSPAILDIDGSRSDMGVYGGPTSVFAPPACQADLTPTAIVYNPADLVAGREILFDSGVQNLYNVPTVNFQIKWYVDNVEVRYGVHRGMPGNATVLNENSAYRWTAARGTHTITFVLDTLGQIPESNEGNNSRSITVTVP